MLQEREQRQWRGCHFLELACSPQKLSHAQASRASRGQGSKRGRPHLPILPSRGHFTQIYSLFASGSEPRVLLLPQYPPLILSISIHLDAQIVCPGPLTRRDDATRIKRRKVYQCDFMNFCVTLTIGTKVRHLRWTMARGGKKGLRFRKWCTLPSTMPTYRNLEPGLRVPLIP